LRITFEHLQGEEPGILFCGGFKSDMQGNKARYLAALCRQHGWQFTRFDYRGHGQSDAKFQDCTIDDWITDGGAVLQHITHGPQILIGSSMGSWIALHLAREFPRRLAGFIGIASAPDFTQRLIWKRLSQSQREAMQAGHSQTLNSHSDEQQIYEISLALIRSGARNAVLNGTLRMQCPVRLLHGTSDTDVPHSLSEELMRALECEDATLTLKHDADHRFSDHACLSLIERAVLELRILYKSNANAGTQPS